MQIFRRLGREAGSSFWRLGMRWFVCECLWLLRVQWWLFKAGCARPWSEAKIVWWDRETDKIWIQSVREHAEQNGEPK